MTMAATPEFYTLDEVADLLRVSEPTLRRWRANGEGPPAIKVGKQLRYARADVLAWAEERKEERP